MNPDSRSEISHAQMPERSGRIEWLARLGLICGSLLVALLIAEAMSRLVVPISDRRDNITLDGEVIRDYLTPGIVYRQVSNEYDALTTITPLGHRVPPVSGSPDVVFIGDSFTFGYGLNDDETFVSIYCRQLRLVCANLGQPGSGTMRQVDRLERYLVEQRWKPSHVRLFFFGMSGSFSAGNDFVDNFNRERKTRTEAAPHEVSGSNDQAVATGIAERVIGWQAFLLRHSNLLRLAKFHAGPALKAMVVAEPGIERMATALEATQEALMRLETLSSDYGFEYEIYLIVPVQDILRGTHPDTLATLNSVSPKPANPTAQVFSDSPSSYYFAYDGHLNPAGSARLAQFLLDTDALASAQP